MDFKKLYIDGQWVAPLSGQYIDVENPATKEVFTTVAAAGEQDVAAASAAAAKAFPAWAARPMEERIDFMRKLLKELIQFEPQMVDATVKELGIPVSFVKTNHIAYQFVRTQSYIDLAPDLPLVEKLPQSVVYRRPLGVIGCITPWNYPLGQVIQKVIPAILVGATVVLKPSQSTPVTPYYLAEAFDRAGFPKGVFNFI
ncbi:MAG: aldehyde dehydrogenase family protein, partial [Megasphaera massiliensis]